MSVFRDIRDRLRPAPPAPTDTFKTLAKPTEPRRKRVKTGRTEQLNLRVKPGFKDRMERLAENAGETLGAFVEQLVAIYESGTAPTQTTPPPGDQRAGRTRPLHLWASEDVFAAIGQIAAERKLTVSALIEDMLAHQVARLDPLGGKFGVDVTHPDPFTSQNR